MSATKAYKCGILSACLLIMAGGVSGCAVSKLVEGTVDTASAAFLKETGRTKPLNPAIEQRIEEKRQQGVEGFPDIADISRERPSKMNAAEREAFRSNIQQMGANLEADIASAQQQADQERAAKVIVASKERRKAVPLDEAAAEIKEAVQSDLRKAASERRVSEINSAVLIDNKATSDQIQDDARAVAGANAAARAPVAPAIPE